MLMISRRLHSTISSLAVVLSRRTRSSSSVFHSQKKTPQTSNLRRLFQPLDVKPMMSVEREDNSNIGQELTGGKNLERSKGNH